MVNGSLPFDTTYKPKNKETNNEWFEVVPSYSFFLKPIIILWIVMFLIEFSITSIKRFDNIDRALLLSITILILILGTLMLFYLEYRFLFNKKRLYRFDTPLIEMNSKTMFNMIKNHMDQSTQIKNEYGKIIILSNSKKFIFYIGNDTEFVSTWYLSGNVEDVIMYEKDLLKSLRDGILEYGLKHSLKYQ